MANEEATMVKFRQGSEENLEGVSHDEGTIYIAKSNHKRAFLHADLDGDRYNIVTPNLNYFGLATINYDADAEEAEVSCEDFILEQGASITVLMQDEFYLYDATLNVNGAGGIPIAYRGSVETDLSLPANSVYTFIYINGKFHLTGDIDTAPSMDIRETTTSTSQGGQLPIISKKYNNPMYGNSIIGEVIQNYPLNVTQYGYVTLPSGLSLGDAYGVNAHSSDNMTTAYYGPSGIEFSVDDYSDYYYLYPWGSNFYIESDSGAWIRLNPQGLYTNGVSATIVSGATVQQNGRRVPNVWYGTEPPTSAIGQDGDIYIMYS